LVKEVKFFDYPIQFKELSHAYLRILENVLESGCYILGPAVEEFENKFAEYVGAKYAIGVGNGTDAILLALYSAGVGRGDEVVTVSHTFVATVEAIKFVGAKPVFVDIAEDHNMDVEQVKHALTKRTKAVIPVQLNGRVCSGMEYLRDITEKYGIILIEDAAQAIGAKYKGKFAGTFGLAGCFSFYPAKVLGAFGDAGAIVTDDERIAKKLRKIRNHGRNSNGNVVALGMNSRLDSLHAAVLTYKLSMLDNSIKRRREIARMYHEGLSDLPCLKLPPPPVDKSDHYDVYQNYEIEAESRDSLKKYCDKRGVETALPWGGKGVHQFRSLGFYKVKLPRTENFFKEALMLPIYPQLTNEQVEYVIETIREFYL